MMRAWQESFVEDTIMRLCDELEAHEDAENNDELYEAVGEAVHLDLATAVEEAVKVAKR